MNKQEDFEQKRFSSIIDELAISGYFEENYTLSEWNYDTWEKKLKYIVKIQRDTYVAQ